MLTRKTQAQLDRCPYECAGSGKASQRPLTPGEFARLSDSARHAIDTTLGQARICDNCWCVHLREAHANVPLGILDGTPGPGWHSGNFA